MEKISQILDKHTRIKMVNAYYLVSNKSNVLTSGAFKPTVYTFVTSGSFPEAIAPNPSPPAAPYVNALSLFNGKDPNGSWKLYVVDDGTNGRAGNITGGWSLTICTDCKCKCGCD